VLRLDHELDPLLVGLAKRILVLVHVLLGKRVDVLVGAFPGARGGAADLQVVVWIDPFLLSVEITA